MKIKVDLESDVLYIRLTEDKIEESEEVTPGLIVDFDKKGKIVGIEIHEIKKRIPLKNLSKIDVELPTTV
jgi:uncharacterized protein YuzE